LIVIKYITLSFFHFFPFQNIISLTKVLDFLAICMLTLLSLVSFITFWCLVYIVNMSGVTLHLAICGDF